MEFPLINPADFICSSMYDVERTDIGRDKISQILRCCFKELKTPFFTFTVKDDPKNSLHVDVPDECLIAMTSSLPPRKNNTRALVDFFGELEPYPTQSDNFKLHLSAVLTGLSSTLCSKCPVIASCPPHNAYLLELAERN